MLLCGSLALVACSSGIDGVAPPIDIDGGSDSSIAADASGDTTMRDTSTGDTAVDDGGSVDGGGSDSIVSSDVPLVDGARPCLVRTTGESTGCTADEYCDAPTCDTGVCKPRGLSAPGFSPVCGCDGLTYWNAHFAKSLGVSFTGSSPCGDDRGVRCGGPFEDCIAPADCVTRGSSPTTCTSVSVSGVCWRVPSDAVCATTGATRKERVCGSSVCKSVCEASIAGDVFFDDPTCL
jgi:hypothetical protein